MKTTVTVYGIPACDTVKRARAWLVAQGIPYTFYDFKKSGVPVERLDAWIAELGYEILLNRQGTTWRKLDEAAKKGITDAESAKQLMIAQPSVIKRPVIEWGKGRLSVGFSVDAPAFQDAASGPR